MQNLKALFEDIVGRTFKITTTAGGKEKIQQTERNNLRVELLESLLADLAGTDFKVARTKDGILVEIPNNSIADGISRDSIGSGALTLAFEVSIKDIDADLEYLAEEYETDQATKAQAKAERTAKAQKKRERDEALRAKKRAQ